MKKTFKILSLLALTSVIANCGGGGGGGSGNGSSSGGTPQPTRSPYVAVTSHSPSSQATNQWVKPEISISFSAGISESSLINTQANIAKFLDQSGYTVCETQSTGACVKLETVPASVTIDDMLEAPVKYLPIAKTTAATANLPQVAGFRVNGSGDARSVALLDSKDQVITSISNAELAASGIFEQNIIQIKDESGHVYKQNAPTILGSKVTLNLAEYLKFETKISVVVRKLIRDTENRPLSSNFSFDFTTQVQPATKVSDHSPKGIDANAIENLKLTVNFEIDPASLDGSVRLRQVLKKAEVDVNGQVTAPAVLGSDLTVRLSLSPTDKKVLIINPEKDLDYLAEYQVDIKGNNGLRGEIGGQLVYLPADHQWTFSTAEPKMISYSPVVASSSDFSVDPNSKISLKFNFRLDESSIKENILVQDVTTGQNLDYNIELPNPQTGLVQLTGLNNSQTRLNYNTQYKVLVKKSLAADVSHPNFATIKLAQDQAFEFSTQLRKIIATIPSKGSSGIEPGTAFEIGFNFNVAPGSLREGIILESSDNGTNWTQQTAQITVTDKTVKVVPTNNFLFKHSVRIRVTNELKDLAGAQIDIPENLNYTVKNELMYVSSFSPSRNSNSASVKTVVTAEFTYPIDTKTIANDAIEVTEVGGGNCGYSTEVKGRISHDTKKLYFTSEKPLKSFCKHRVTVSKDIKGTRNETQDGSALTWDFTTDGLQITAVRLTGSRYDAWTETDIEVEFNKDIDTYSFRESRLALENRTHYWDVSTDSRVRSNKIIVDPRALLRYGNTYRLEVDKDSSGSYVIQGVDGERLNSDYYFDFEVENMDINVISYGPAGSYVPVGSEFYVRLDENIEDVIDAEDYPKVEVRLTNGGFSESGSLTIYNERVSFRPYSDLDKDDSHEVEFRFKHRDGSVDTFDWDFMTTNSAAPGVSAMAAQSPKAQILKNGQPVVQLSAKDKLKNLESIDLLKVSQDEKAQGSGMTMGQKDEEVEDTRHGKSGN